MSRPQRRFYFRLALALGCTVRELLQRIDAQELAEWQIFCGIEPFGDEWRQSAMISASCFNAFGGKKNGQPVKPEEFMPIVKHEATPEQQRKAFEAALISSGLEIKKAPPVS